jgi:predicted P-loop ATPase
VIDLQALLRERVNEWLVDRDQLWAEALVRFRSRAPWWLETPELQSVLAVPEPRRIRDRDHVRSVATTAVT